MIPGAPHLHADEAQRQRGQNGHDPPPIDVSREDPADQQHQEGPRPSQLEGPSNAEDVAEEEEVDGDDDEDSHHGAEEIFEEPAGDG